MTTLNTTITATDRADARNAIRALLVEANPTYDISVGGIIDSTIVEGNVSVAANNITQVNKAYLYQQLKAISEGTVSIEDAQMDNLAANYLVTRLTNTAATGSVEFVVSDNKQYVISASYLLTYNGSLTYGPASNFTIYPVGATGVDFTVATNIQLIELADAETGYQYRFRIPVICSTTGPTGIRVTGDEFAPSPLFPGLGVVRSVESFSGGTTAETNAQLAQRCLSGITAKVLNGGQDHNNALVASLYPNAQASAVGVNSPVQTRGRGNPFGINTGGFVDLYIKTGGIASYVVPVTATVVDKTARTATIVIPFASSVGLYTAAGVGLTSSAGMTGTISSSGISYSEYLRSDFAPSCPLEIDFAFSANCTATITITDTRINSDTTPIVPMTSNGQVLTGVYGVAITYMPGIGAIADQLYSDAVRPPGLDILVKAVVPCITTLNIVAAKQANYNGLSSAQLQDVLAAYFNSLPLRLTSIDTNTIGQLLTQASTQLTLTSVGMSGTILGQDGTNIVVSQVDGVLSIPVVLASKVSYENTAFITDPSLITVTLV